MRDNYLEPRVDVHIEDTPEGDRHVRIGIVPGPKFARVTLAFEGAVGIDPDVLVDIVHDQDLEEDLFTDPVVVTELLRRYYREEGYLAASLAEPIRQVTGDAARIVIRIDEGPRFVVSRLTPSGNAAVPAATLLEEAPLRVGDPFLPAVAERSIERIRQFYWRRGYSDVQLRYEVDANRDTGDAAISLLVNEGARAVRQHRDGGRHRPHDHGSSARTARPRGRRRADVAALGQARRSLYATGAYSLVEMTREPAATPVSPADTALTCVTVREVQPGGVRRVLRHRAASAASWT
jgi:hypothetical protein